MNLKILFFVLFCLSDLFAIQKLKVGVLAFGTVNWELNVLKHNELDKKYGFDLEVVKLASKNAVSIALQSGSVDIIVNDWVWVNRQRFDGKDLTFYPYSKAIGGIYVNEEANIKSLLDLQDKSFGVAGGSVDKTWLLFRAYAKKKYNKDLKNIVSPIFAAPPFLYKKVLNKSLDASINFWHYNAKLQAKGIKRLIGLQEVLNNFEIKNDIPFIGWTFDRGFAKDNKKLVNNFLQASYESKNILNKSDDEWNRIRNKMKAKNDNVFASLKNGYKDGIVKDFSSKNIDSSEKVFQILLSEGGKKLVGNSKSLDDKTFWEFTPNIKW